MRPDSRSVSEKDGAVPQGIQNTVGTASVMPSAAQLMSLPGKQALEAILESPMPARLVQSLAEQDLFWLVQDIGPEDALPILARASNEQWQYLLDMAVWHRDRLQHGAVDQWMALLMQADCDRFVAWAIHHNIELVELHLSRSVQVRIRDRQEEAPADFGDGFFTLDDVFYVRVSDNKSAPTIRRFLEHLAALDLERYHNLLLEMGGLLPAETEEQMYRVRSARLAEKGFLPFEEAVGIYQALSPEQLTGQGRRAQKAEAAWDLLPAVPVSGGLLITDWSLFHRALRVIQDGAVLEGLQSEFAALCNRIMSADCVVATDRQDLAAIVVKACGYLDIALERLAGRDPKDFVPLLSRFALDDIFRVGYGAAVELKWRAEKWWRGSWFLSRGLGLDFWADPWESLLEGLSAKRPRFFAGFSSPNGEPFREFRTLEEIVRSHQDLDEMMALDDLFRLLFAESTAVRPAGAVQPINYKNLLLTQWARDHFSLAGQVQPLDRVQLRRFFDALWRQGQRPYTVRPEMKASFMKWIAFRAGVPTEEIRAPDSARARPLARLFDELEQEYGAVSLDSLDPRYIKHFLVRR